MIKMDINQSINGLILKNCSPTTELELESAASVVVINKEVIIQAISYLNFPTVGKINALYIDTTTNKSYRWDENNFNYYVVGSDYNDINIRGGGSTTVSKDETGILISSTDADTKVTDVINDAAKVFTGLTGNTTIQETPVEDLKLGGYVKTAGTGAIVVNDTLEVAFSKIENNIINSVDNKYVHPNHTGDVTSVADGATTITKTAITGKTEVTADATDYVLISDTSDSGNLKKALLPADIRYVHEQAIPSDTWVISHNLNKYPNVTVVDSAGSVVIGNIAYDTINQITATFSGIFSGKAFLN